MVSKSPNWGCFPSKWPFMAYKCGLLTTYKSWDDPPSSFSQQLLTNCYWEGCQPKTISSDHINIWDANSYQLPIKVLVLFRFQMAIHGLLMGVILTTYKSWDDPPSREYDCGSKTQRPCGRHLAALSDTWRHSHTVPGVEPSANSPEPVPKNCRLDLLS